MPNNRQPATLTVRVPKGKEERTDACTYLAIVYLRTDPIKPPIPIKSKVLTRNGVITGNEIKNKAGRISFY